MVIGLDRLKVLVVDDNPQALKIMKMVLAGLGVHHIYTAKDGVGAQEFLGQFENEVDVVICDWEMPRMSGLELLKEIRKKRPDMPFMMVTGHAEITSVQRAIKSGVNAYVSKPFTPQQMKEKITALAFGLERAA